MLQLKNINKKFAEVEVLKDINLDVKEGEVVSLLGLSGSGKSTILNIISGFEENDSGEVIYKDEVLSNGKFFVAPQNRKIGFVFQNYALFPHMNIFDNITFGISKLPKDEKNRVVDGLLRLIGLEGIEKRYPHELSGGQQQRVALVRTMALNPELILLDEPFSSIDSMAKASIQKELLSILKNSKKTAIIVTHDPNEAMAMSDKIVYLEKGKIVQCDTPKNIYDFPKTKLIAKSFGVANFIVKDDKEYCIRPQQCKIVDNEADIKASVENMIDYGEYVKLFLNFRFQNKDYEFIYINKELDKKYNVSQLVNLCVDFKKSHQL